MPYIAPRWAMAVSRELIEGVAQVAGHGVRDLVLHLLHEVRAGGQTVAAPATASINSGKIASTEK